MSEPVLKRFRIPNRDVKLTPEEVDVTSTLAFQRLFSMKQLGLAYLVYPCATHTRGGHSIECLDEATKMLDAVRPPVEKWGDDYKAVRMAALLHDIGHLPFSHTLEDENEVIMTKHDKKERLDELLEAIKAEVLPGTKAIVDMAKPILLGIADKDDTKRDWRSDLVGNTVCADLLAYITTDAAWTGIEKRPGYYRIYDYLVRRQKPGHGGVPKDRLCIELTKGGLRTDVVSAILDLLDMRYALYERVTFHHAKAVASAMLARSARLANVTLEPELLTLGDEGFLNWLDRRGASLASPAGDGSQRLLRALRSRRLYKRMFKIQREARVAWEHNNGNKAFCDKWRDSAHVESLLCDVEDQYSLPRGSLVLWCPEGKSGMKLVKANVTWEQAKQWHEPVELRSEDVAEQYPGVHKRVHTIEEQYKDLWTFWVAMDSQFAALAPGVMGALEERIGVGCDEAFRHSYASGHLNDFEEADRAFAAADQTWERELKPEVGPMIRQLAAKDGKPPTSDVIKEAILTLTSQKAKTAAKSKAKTTGHHPDTPLMKGL